jgi:FKBP-type peptidyl-prolyl cis-trans isomerase
MKKPNPLQLEKAVKEIKVRKALTTAIIQRVEQTLFDGIKSENIEIVRQMLAPTMSSKIATFLKEEKMWISSYSDAAIAAAVDEFMLYFNKSDELRLMATAIHVILSTIEIFNEDTLMDAKKQDQILKDCEKRINDLNIRKDGDYEHLIAELRQQLKNTKQLLDFYNSSCGGGVVAAGGYTADFAGGDSKQGYSIVNTGESIINRREATNDVLGQLSNIAKESGHVFDADNVDDNFKKHIEKVSIEKATFDEAHLKAMEDKYNKGKLEYLLHKKYGAKGSRSRRAFEIDAKLYMEQMKKEEAQKADEFDKDSFVDMRALNEKAEIDHYRKGQGKLSEYLNLLRYRYQGLLLHGKDVDNTDFHSILNHIQSIEKIFINANDGKITVTRDEIELRSGHPFYDGTALFYGNIEVNGIEDSDSKSDRSGGFNEHAGY